MSNQVPLIDFARFCFCGALAGLSFAGVLGFTESATHDFVSASIGVLSVAMLRHYRVI